MFEQFQSLLASSIDTQPQAYAMTTTRSGLHGSYTAGILPTKWILDSGSSNHTTSDLSILSQCTSPASPITISSANVSSVNVVWLVSIGSIFPSSSIADVFNVPQISISLLSYSGFDVHFFPHLLVYSLIQDLGLSYGSKICFFNIHSQFQITV